MIAITFLCTGTITDEWKEALTDAVQTNYVYIAGPEGSDLTRIDCIISPGEDENGDIIEEQAILTVLSDAGLAPVTLGAWKDNGLHLGQWYETVIDDQTKEERKEIKGDIKKLFKDKEWLDCLPDMFEPPDPDKPDKKPDKKPRKIKLTTGEDDVHVFYGWGHRRME